LQSYGVKKAKIKSLAVITDPAPFTNVFPKPKVRSIFPVGSFILLTVARFVPQKNLRLMLKAFYQAQRQSPTLRLIIIGQGPDQKMIETIIEKNEGPDKKLVEVLPWTDDVPGFMASVDAYVLSSNYEGWGRVLIEALYANLPIVTTDVGCVGEVILDQEHALVVPINNETALTVALVELSTNPIKYQHIKNKMLSQSVPNNASYDSYANDWISTLR